MDEEFFYLVFHKVILNIQTLHVNHLLRSEVQMKATFVLGLLRHPLT